MPMFDEAKAQRAITFIESLKHTKGRWAGVRFELLPWQRNIIRDIFGTVRPDGFRQYRTAYIEIPKKNGKSELAAAVALYLLAGDGEIGAEIYGAAADRQQAAIVFDVAVAMVEQEPALKKRIKLIPSQRRMVYLPTRSFYQVLSSEAYTKHGINPHGIIFDELHAQPTRELWDVLTHGASDARDQPLTFAITTAGDDPDRTSIGWEIHSYAKKVLDGTINDPSFYAVIYGAAEDDDWTDERVWKKANPSLGYTIQIERVREAFNRAKANPAEEKLFRQLRLNQWVKMHSTSWLSLDDWDATAGAVDHEALAGRDCFGGLDLSSKLDLTAFVLVFPPTDDDPNYYVLPYFWIPRDTMKERIRTDRVPYDQWEKAGYITSTPGGVVDYDFVIKAIDEAARLYNIREIAFDPWNATQTALKLADLGLTMVEARQGYRTMSPAMKEIEVLIHKELLRHGGHPVLRWNFSNVEVKADENDNIRPIKQRGSARIDGIVALINAMTRVIVHRAPKPSTYEEADLMVI